MVLGAAEGLNEFGGNRHCQGWYQKSMEALLSGNGCEQITGNDYTECKAAIETKMAGTGGIFGEAAASTLGDLFEALANNASQACGSCPKCRK